jgi:hypothetical protein
MKNIKTRIQESFGEAKREDISKYLEWVSTKIITQAQGLRRMVALIVLLIAAFELINEYPKTQMTLGGFHLYKGSVVLQFLPAFIAFLYLQSLIETLRLNDAQRAYASVLEMWSKKATKNQLEDYVMPSMPIYWNIGAYASAAPKTFTIRLELVLSIAFSAFIRFGLLAFEAQAYYDLFVLPARDNILWTISAFGATFFCLTALVIFYGKIFDGIRADEPIIGSSRFLESISS